MADSPQNNAGEIVTISIKSDGSKISDTIFVRAVSVHSGLAEIPKAVIRIADGSPATNEFPVLDGHDFAVGTKIEICASWDDHKEDTLFKGIVTAVELRIDQNDESVMDVTCEARAAKLKTRSGGGFFASMTDSDILKEVIEAAGLGADISATNDTATDHLRPVGSDWDFVSALAARNGFVLSVDDDTISAHKPDTDATPILTLTYGSDIIEFHGKTSASLMSKSNTARAWNTEKQNVVEASAGMTKTQSWGNVTPHELAEVMATTTQSLTAADLPENSLAQRCTAQQDRAALAAIEGYVTYIGNAQARPGDMIELKGLGARMEANALVSGVHHKIEDGRWTTRATLGLPWPTEVAHNTHPGAADPAMALQGTQIGKVVQLTEDPDGLQRIKVNLPLFDAEIWARFAQPYASNTAGIQFLPEVNDEVVIAFLSADPSAAVIIGALHNPTAERVNEPTEENALKEIKTKSGLSVQFDDEKKTLMLLTPGGHNVILDDDSKSLCLTDLTGNSIKMEPSGITIDSQGDLTMNAVGNSSLSATGDMQLKGMNVSLEADAEASVTGNANAKLTSKGQTSVTGSMIMIN